MPSDLIPEGRNPKGLPEMALFDVDGTLIDKLDNPREEILDLLVALFNAGLEIGVWSGGGGDYAEMWVNRLGVGPYVAWVGSKLARPTDNHVLFTVDDVATTDFGVPNIHV